MHGSVHFRVKEDAEHVFDAAGPAILRYSKQRIIVEVDPREVIKSGAQRHALMAEFGGIAEKLLTSYHWDDPDKRHVNVPVVNRVHRVRRVAGGRLLAAEVVDDVIHLEVARRHISGILAFGIEQIGEDVGHYLTPQE